MSDDIGGGRHASHQLLEPQHILSAKNPLDLRRRLRGRALRHRVLLLVRGVPDQNLEHETILLCLRQRIGPFLLDRVLRREHEERQRQVVAIAAGRHLPLLHRLEQRRLRLRRRAVDLVGQNHVREDRTGQELEASRAGGFDPPGSLPYP